MKPDAILHAASSGVTGHAELAEMLRSNVLGTDSLLSAVKSLDQPPPVVIAGSGYEYAPQNAPLTEDDPVFPTSPYGVSKAASTFCAAGYSALIPITVLRIFNVYGPGERLPRLLPYLVHNAKLGNPVELTPCEQIRDFVYVRDVAALFWQALECAPQNRRLRILNVGSGSARPLKDFICIVVRVLEKKGIRPRLEFGSRPYRANEPRYYVANTNRLETVLGLIPKTPLETGIAETVASIL
jgi:nucleoside-diphosphate-sugar epimerase